MTKSCLSKEVTDFGDFYRIYTLNEGDTEQQVPWNLKCKQPDLVPVVTQPSQGQVQLPHWWISP